MSKTTALTVSVLCSLLATTGLAEPQSSLLTAAISTPVSAQQGPAPIIEASIDEPASLAPHSSNSDNIEHQGTLDGDLGQDAGATNHPATIAYIPLAIILFANEQVELSPAQTAAIDRAAARIQRSGGLQKSILVTAHADDNGDDSRNLQLSYTRASNVANYLKKHGIIEHLILTHSFGRSQPRNENWTESGRQHNRRVSITLIQSNSEASSI